VPLPERGACAPQRRREPRLAVAAGDLLALAAIDVEHQAGDALGRAVALALDDAAAMKHPQPAVSRG
jgi:hypothetical protein